MEKVIVVSRLKSVLKEVGMILFLALAITFLGKITIPLPMTPIPMALRPQLVILLAWIFGTQRTLGAISLFCAMNLAGLPSLVSPASFTTTIFGPTFGYIFSYFVIAIIAPELKRRGWKATSSFVLLSIIIEIIGALGLSCFVGIRQGFYLGFLPFVLGDCLKAILSAWVYQRFAVFSGR